MIEQTSPLLVVGLGNPGKNYSMTRHNIGFLLVDSLANQLGVSLQKNKEFHGDCADCVVGGCKIFLLEPTTYMNRSGEAVRKLASYYKINPDRILVICDDVALAFGKLRIRSKGSSGGHNGLKSIEHSLSTQEFIRLKIGVGQDITQELADFVLAPFSETETAKLSQILFDAKEVVMTWILSGYDAAVKKIEERRLKRLSENSDKEKIKED